MTKTREKTLVVGFARIGRKRNERSLPILPFPLGEPPDVPLDGDEEDERRRHVRRGGTVRKSRMTRQRSYDDEMKNVAAMSGGGAQHAHPEPGLGLPVQLPRRASAYDVYATPGAAGLNAMAIAAAQQRASISAQGTTATTTTTIPIYPVNIPSACTNEGHAR